MRTTTVQRIVSYRSTVAGRAATVWVGLGAAPGSRDDPDDRTMPEVTHRYLSKRALTAAMADGSAFLPEDRT